MQWTPLARRRHRTPATSATPATPATPHPPSLSRSLPVFFDARTQTFASTLTAPLRPVDDIAAAHLAVLITHAAVLGRLCERHPNLRVLAIVPVGRENGGSKLASDLLEAGAERCLIQPSAAEVAAQLRALARRDGVFLTQC
jgi:hypothetical protein